MFKFLLYRYEDFISEGDRLRANIGFVRYWGIRGGRFRGEGLERGVLGGV